MAFRLATIDGRATLVEGDGYHDLEALSGGTLSPDPMAALAAGDRLHDLADGLDGHRPTGHLADVTLGPPVPRPQKCFGIGLNYRSHAAETAATPPTVPLVFTKFPSCLVGPTADVVLRSDGCDYEGELVVVIGPGGRDIDVDRAWDHVVGLTVGQDISDRPVQRATTPAQFNLGKSFDTFGPTGPVVVSPDAVVDPDDLAITTLVNGEQRQHDTTASMIFDVPTLVAYLSRVTTLAPGDLIFTGTPAGVGMADGRYLGDGDVITTTIDGIGALTNRCVRGPDHGVLATG